MAIPSRIIDTHQHCFWLGRDDKKLIADIDEHGIDKTWLLTWDIAPEDDRFSNHIAFNPLNVRSDGTHAGANFRDIVQTRDRYPDRFVLGCCPHPAVGDAPGVLRSAVKIFGVQVYGEWGYRIPFDDPRSLEVFHVAGELKLPVVMHLDVPYLKNEQGQRVYQSMWAGGTVDNLERALQACPKTVFVGHAPAFWREISSGADDEPEAYPRGPILGPGKIYDLLDRYPNLYADLSAGSGLYALQRDNEHAKRFIERYCDRLMFARDNYGSDLHNYLQTLDLAPGVTEKIYHLNAEKLLNNETYLSE